MVIKVYALDRGCSRQVFRVLDEAIQQAGADVVVEKIEDPQSLARARVMAPPVIEISGKTVVRGRTPKVAEVVEWIMEALVQEDQEIAR
ncbi:MAG: thioredoxin family protein [Desulfitobacteriaceae bacterium]|nr:thioredoxin family protein [Desulfitobacteriaceae bacterium]